MQSICRLETDGGGFGVGCLVERAPYSLQNASGKWLLN